MAQIPYLKKKQMNVFIHFTFLFFQDLNGENLSLLSLILERPQRIPLHFLGWSFSMNLEILPSKSVKLQHIDTVVM